MKALRAEVERLKEVKIDHVVGVLARHAVAVGAVGPMPVAKATDPWAGALERIEEAAAREPDDCQAGGRGMSIEEAIRRYVKPARPRVGGWVQSGPTWCAYDDRGVQVAYVWQVGDHYAWWAARPFLGNKDASEKTLTEAKAAAVAVLATWADVEGQAVTSEGDRRFARLFGDPPRTMADHGQPSERAPDDADDRPFDLPEPVKAPPQGATVPGLDLGTGIGGQPIRARYTKASGPPVSLADSPIRERHLGNPDAARLAAVHDWIASLPIDKRHEASRRASVSYSDEFTALHRGGRIEGADIVWPDGERYPRRTVDRCHECKMGNHDRCGPCPEACGCKHEAAKG